MNGDEPSVQRPTLSNHLLGVGGGVVRQVRRPPSPDTTGTSSLGQDTQGQDGVQEGRHPKTGRGSTGLPLAGEDALRCACAVCLGGGDG